MKHGLSDRVRECIRERLSSSEASLESVAASMELHPRSLSRRLSRSDVTFRQLKEEARCSLAIGYLKSGLRIEDVSGKVGFTDPPSFYRAFRRWTGMTPNSFKARQFKLTAVERSYIQ